MGDSKYKPDRPVFCGNFEYDAREREIERLFDKYGPVEKIDMKTGFAFVYMIDRRDGDDAIRKLNGMTFGDKRRKLRVEWASQPEEPKRETKPKTSLFVVNFDARRVTERDLEKYFSRWGRLIRTEIKKNYAFIQYDKLSEAQDALDAAHNSEFMGRRLSVEYVANDDPTRRGVGDSYDDRGARSPVRGRSLSPRRRSSMSPRRRSRSPYYGGGDRNRPIGAQRRSPSPRRRSMSPPPRRSPTASRRSPSPRRFRSRSPVRKSFTPVRNRPRSPRRSYSR